MTFYDGVMRDVDCAFLLRGTLGGPMLIESPSRSASECLRCLASVVVGS